jgi:hypothetical protein
MLNKNIQTGAEDEKSMNFERISEFIEDGLSILSQSNAEDSEEWRRVATKSCEHCHNNLKIQW